MKCRKGCHKAAPVTVSTTLRLPEWKALVEEDGEALRSLGAFLMLCALHGKLFELLAYTTILYCYQLRGSSRSLLSTQCIIVMLLQNTKTPQPSLSSKRPSQGRRNFGKIRHSQREFLLFVFLGLLKRRQRVSRKENTPSIIFLILQNLDSIF